MRRLYGPGGRGAPCGSPQDLEELSHGLALNPSPLLLTNIKEQEVVVSYRCPSGAHPMRYISAPLEVFPGSALGSQEVWSQGRRAGKSFPLGCAGSMELLHWAGLGCALEASPEPGTQSAHPVLLPDCDCLASGTGWLNCLEISPPNSF